MQHAKAKKAAAETYVKMQFDPEALMTRGGTPVVKPPPTEGEAKAAHSDEKAADVDGNTRTPSRPADVTEGERRRGGAKRPKLLQQ